MKNLLFIAFTVFVVLGCSGSEVQDVPNKDRVQRKEYKDMTAQEKIDFINRTPMPQDAKDRAIAGIKAGRE
jgi:hypothetical protein